MRKALITIVVSLGLATLLPHPAATGAAPPGFKVIVNSSNSVTSLTSDEVSQIFLKRMTHWPAGGAVTPVDLPASSSVREAFSRKIHGRSANSIETFWTKQIFSGAAVPPLTLSSDREVIAYVRQNAGAIGYVSATATIPETVRTIEITN